MATVRLRDVLDDGESEARPTEVAAARLVDAIEALEQPRDVLSGDARPLVVHADHDLAADHVHGDDDGAPVRAVLHRVVDEVDDRLLEEGRVHGREGTVPGGDFERDLLGLRLGLADLDGGPYHLADVRLFGGEVAPVLRLLHRRQREQVADDRVEPIGLPGDDAHKAVRGRRIVDGTVVERLRETLDGRDGRLELVRHVGDEIATHRLEPLQPRDVVEHDDRAGRAALRGAAEERAVGLQGAILRPDADGDVRLYRLVPLEGGLDGALQVGVAHDLLDALALGRRRIDIQQLRGGLVERDHTLVRVHRDDALDHAREHRLALVALAGERADLFAQFVGHVVEAGRHHGELARTRLVQLVREVAGGQASGARCDLAHLTTDPAGHVEADQRRQGGDDERAHGDAHVQRVQRLIERVERQRRAHDRGDDRALPGGDGDVHHPFVERGTGPDDETHAAAERRGHLWARSVILHRRGVGNVGIGDDGADGDAEGTGGDQRDAGARFAPEPYGQALQLRLGVGADPRRDIGADELRARQTLVLGVGDVEAARGADRIEADRPRAQQDDDEIGHVDTPEEARSTHGSLVLQAIPHAAHRLDIGTAGSQLAAQRDDMHVDRAVGHKTFVDEYVISLRGVDDLLPREHPSGPLGQVDKDAELGGRELRRHTGHENLMAPRVDVELPHTDGGVIVAHVGAAAQHRFDARREDAGAERLGDVVGRAHLQPGHDVGLAALGGEHHDGDAARLEITLEPAAYLQPVHTREHEIEHDDVRHLRARRREGVLASLHDGHLIARFVEVVRDELEDVPLVVDDEHALRGHHHRRATYRQKP